MKAMRRVAKLLKEEKIDLSNYSSIENAPISIKLRIVEDLMQHIDDNGTGYPTYGTLNLRSNVNGVIQAYSKAITNAPNGWYTFIKMSERLANLILREYVGETK